MRDAYFKSKIQPQPTPALYIKALQDSPYKTHRRMVEPLLESFGHLIIEEAAQYYNKKESNENTE